MASFHLKGKNVMVAGGAGFIGSHLVDRLIPEQPGKIVVVDNLFLGKERNLQSARDHFPELKFYRQDVTDLEEMKGILGREGIEVVFNLAVIPLPASLERPYWSTCCNVGIAAVAVELLRQECYQTLVHFSSSEVYGSAQYVPMDEEHPLESCTPYAAGKVAGDHLVSSYRRTFGLDLTILRPFNNFGPRQNEGAYAGIIPIAIRKALAGEPITIYGDGEQTRDFVFVKDVADAAIAAFANPQTRGRIINVASGQEVSVNSLVRSILSATGAEVPLRYQPPRPGDVRRHAGDNRLARALLDFVPKTSFEEGIGQAVDWYRSTLER